MDSRLCVAGGRGAGSSARVSVFCGPLQQGPAGSQVSVWKPKLGKGKQQTQFKTPRRDHCRMLGNISLEKRCWHEGRFSCFSSAFFLESACSLGRLVDHGTMGEKEGRAVEVQADQVKEEGNVIDAVERK